MKLRRDLLLTLALALAACSAAASGGPDTTTGTAGSAAPATTDPTSTLGTTTTSTSVTSTTTTTSSLPGLAASTTTMGQPVGQRAAGNRVLMIGDSILASTSARYGGTMCSALVPLGWQVEIDAESGRFVEFGEQVLRSRLAAGWDAAVIMLGNNFDGNADTYRLTLTDLVNQLSPQPVVLLTVTEFKADRAAVNDAIWDLAATRPNVTVLDWAARTVDAADLLGGDGLHLSDLGRATIAWELAAAMGTAPAGPGRCLPTGYTDDSAGPVTGTTVRNSPATTARPRPRPSGTTVRPAPGPTITQRPSSTTILAATTAAPPPSTEAPPTTAKPKPTNPPTTSPPDASSPPSQ